MLNLNRTTKEKFVEERDLLIAFLTEVHKYGEAGYYWGTLHSEDYADFSSFKIVLVKSSKVSYKDLEDFCVANGIEGFTRCKEGRGIIKVYLNNSRPKSCLLLFKFLYLGINN